VQTKGWIVRIALSVSALTVPAAAHAQCRAPTYVVALNFIAPHGSIGTMQVSVDPADVTVETLVCLARILRVEHPEWTDVFVPILDSYEAARSFQPDMSMNLENWRPSDDKHVRAVYFLDSKPAREYLQFTPLGWEQTYPTGDFGTRIDFLAADAVNPRCPVAFGDRCLMALAAYRYPDERRKENVFGSVTLTARIARSGEVVAIRNTATTGGAGLVREAMQNLRSWRFEPAPHEDAIEITYNYISDLEIPPGTVTVQLESPNLVTFRANPINPPQ
jgi:TonB family protein